MPTRSLSPFLLLVALLVSCVASCSSDKLGEKTPASTVEAPGRGVYVPLTWRDARTVAGHRVHVQQRQISCTSCHELTATTMGAVKPSRCAACHAKEGQLEHATSLARQRFGAGAKTDCTVCHAFVPPQDGGSPSPSDCLRCHEVAQGRTPAIRVHDQEGKCLSCHRPHEDPTPKSAPCSTCHRDVSLAHAAHGGDSGCKGCHEHQHAKAEDALGGCTGCHSSREPLVPATALFSGGHERCVDCHQPHAFEKKLVRPCRTCHQRVHVLSEQTVPAHQQCTSCHDAHSVRGSPEAACANCHRDLHPDHPKPTATASGTSTCVGCHDPHPAPGAAHGLARPCSSCHTTAKSDTSFHSSTECKTCHAPHDFVFDDGGKALCHRCHENKFVATSANPGHQACSGCHGGLPHEPGTGSQSCPTCHAKEHDRANAGHAACTNCHEPHGGKVTAACKDCHAAEARTAPAGHAECLKCHEQHSGAPEHAACATCHAREAATKHGHLSADCSNCHRPHGPQGPVSPPPCVTCHDAGKLPGLHQAGKHTGCLGCHTGHEDPAAALRAPCLSCHKDRAKHFPDAPRCASCHLFE